MLLHAAITEKSLGHNLLLSGFELNVEPNEKVAIIGRNGVGKTTLFTLLSGQDSDYSGDIIYRKNSTVVTTRQEHHSLGDQTALDYIVANLPEYEKLHHIIETYPETMGDDLRKIEIYSNALERFTQLDYFTVADRIRQSFDAYQLSGQADLPMRQLSGGQKRFVELIRVEHSNADLALIDEPTNHMDYVAKAAFLEWFKNVRHAVVVITHDRDLLESVTRIVEVKDKRSHSFNGNYAAYLSQNAANTANSIHEYEVGLRTLDNLHKQIQAVRAKKASTSKTPNPFIPLERRLLKEYETLEASLEKPSFWIDQASTEQLRPKMEESYHKHKAKTIKIARVRDAERTRDLIQLDNVQVGYNEHALFDPLSARIQTGERLRIVGRNGAGKTTLVRAVMATAEDHRPETLLHGKIVLDTKLRLNTYEQEIDESLLSLGLGDAIEHIYRQYDISLPREKIMRTLSDYLFDPHADYETPVAQLSGGQKARLQLIKVFANSPNLIILDEPTNHLDLPSIEELETALRQYKGAVVYISHDSYFADGLRSSHGDELQLNNSSSG